MIDLYGPRGLFIKQNDHMIMTKLSSNYDLMIPTIIDDDQMQMMTKWWPDIDQMMS